MHHKIQQKNHRSPCLKPDPSNETRWNGVIDETVRANLIMGDISDTLDRLLGPCGEDRSVLKVNEIASNDFH